MAREVVFFKIESCGTPIFIGGYAVPFIQGCIGEPVGVVSPVVAAAGVVEGDQGVTVVERTYTVDGEDEVSGCAGDVGGGLDGVGAASRVSSMRESVDAG